MRDDPKKVQAVADNLESEQRPNLTDKGSARGVVTAVNSLRQQLLDVGKRNKLINAPVRKDRAKQITIEDELADEVFKILYLQGKSMTFQPAPDSVSEKVEDTADETVFMPTEDVEPGPAAAARHSDSKLQTRLTADRLQKKLLTLYRDAQALEEEQGISVLFLVLGFLRWYESDSSQIERCAPLILLPVDLERSSARGRFRLVFRDQDLEPNLSLRALLSTDFELTLPDFPEGDKWLPSDYFERVREAVSSRSTSANRGSRNNGTKTHAKPRPRSVFWWLLALKEQSPGGSVRDLSLSRDGPNRHIGVLRAELSHLPAGYVPGIRKEPAQGANRAELYGVPQAVGVTPSPINVTSVLVVKEEVAQELSLFDLATVRGGLVVVEEVYRHPAMVSNSRSLPFSVRFRSIVSQPPTPRQQFPPFPLPQ